ncbi:SDR family NAD(P)-dependent oxidoreductase [Streptomyces sp. NPDC086549]|uniref:SDR family NAD(P)-dependent oxidoreductase n=1 Tax=Streptomyces sp. NPDC086549 TaxID=3365752 RepID=UPI00381BB566
MDLGLKDRVYVVTGGTRGLGRATARELLADGAKVVVSGRSEQSLASVRELGEPDRVIGVAADNADAQTPARLIGAARRFGRLDGVLISVGGPRAGTSDTVDDGQWRDAFESVFLGAVRLARAAAEELSEGGVIGFVLSTSVHEPIPGLAVSNALRPGLAGYAKSLANELGPRGIRVVGLLPGYVETDRARELQALKGDAADAVADVPLRRFGAPEEFGRAAAFLLSPAASYVTGVMLSVDGGARNGF